MVDGNTPETRESLLVRVRDLQDREAWEQFAQIYRPVVYRLARNRGLQDADAQDLSQKVLISVAKAIPDWQQSSSGGKFRHWLHKVAKNATINALSRQPRDQASGGSSAANRLKLQIDETDESWDEIDLEYRRQLYRRAAEIVRSRADEITWKAFSLTMIDSISVRDTAERLGCSDGVVYAARSRIMKRLRDVVSELENGE